MRDVEVHLNQQIYTVSSNSNDICLMTSEHKNKLFLFTDQQTKYYILCLKADQIRSDPIAGPM